jgi:hypothetical protein
MYNAIRRDLKCDKKTVTGCILLLVSNIMSHRKWRQVHVAAQVSFIAIIIIAGLIELGSIYYYRQYVECSSWVEPLDRMIVLPLLATGHISGLAMITLHVHSGKRLDPILDEIMWLFNLFGLFWASIDLFTRNGILLSDSDDALLSEKKDFPMTLFLVRLLVNLVSLAFIFALKRKMNTLSKSMKTDVIKKE